ncbi:MAG: cyclase family protein [Burkholderiaceae bacterium]
MSADALATFFPGLQRADLPDGEAWAIEEIQLNSHNGTHLLAPHHFASTMKWRRARAHPRRGQPRRVFPARRQARLPASARRPRGAPGDVSAELARIGHTLRPLEIVVTTRDGRAYGTPEYTRAGCGMGYEATM